MGIFDDLGHAAQDVFDKGVDWAERGANAASRAVNGLAMEQQPFVRSLGRLCAMGSACGWHEANGGNVSMIVTPDEVERCRGYIEGEPGDWQMLPMPLPQIADAYVLTTRSGAYLRNVEGAVKENSGVIQMSPAGDAWRVIWGFGDGRPTSEIVAHLQIFAARVQIGRPVQVIYHAHPANLVALSSVESLDSRAFTRALWKSQAECLIVAPRGVEVLPWFTPGSQALANACASALCDVDFVVAVNHGVFAVGESADQVFSAVETLDKVAGIRLAALAARGGMAPAQVIPDEGLIEISQRYGLPVNARFL